jgi:hypothetical protein
MNETFPWLTADIGDTLTNITIRVRLLPKEQQLEAALFLLGWGVGLALAVHPEETKRSLELALLELDNGALGPPVSEGKTQ